MSWSWALYKATVEQSVEEIVTVIDEESCSLFREISFEDWLRYFIEYEKKFVNKFFLQHELLSRRLHSYLDRYSKETNKYIEVIKISYLRYSHWSFWFLITRFRNRVIKVRWLIKLFHTIWCHSFVAFQVFVCLSISKTSSNLFDAFFKLRHLIRHLSFFQY